MFNDCLNFKFFTLFNLYFSGAFCFYFVKYKLYFTVNDVMCNIIVIQTILYTK